MSRISWGTMGKALREAENALGNPNQACAAQKLAKATGYINAINSKVSKEPKRFSGRDIEKLQQVVHCLRNMKLRNQERRENISGYLAQGLLAIKALQEVMGSFTRGAPHGAISASGGGERKGADL